MENNIAKIKAFLIELLQRKSSVSLFANYFVRIEENYAKAGLADKFEVFIADYLAIYSNEKNYNKDDIYVYFRDFYNYASKIKSDENILKHFYRYSNYYLKLLTADISDVDIKNLIKKINRLNAVETYPYLLEVFEDYEFSHINKSTFVDILETVVEYSADKNFSSREVLPFSVLSMELNKMLAVKNYIPQLEPVKPKKKNSVTINELLKQY